MHNLINTIKNLFADRKDRRQWNISDTKTIHTHTQHINKLESGKQKHRLKLDRYEYICAEQLVCYVNVTL